MKASSSPVTAAERSPTVLSILRRRHHRYSKPTQAATDVAMTSAACRPKNATAASVAGAKKLVLGHFSSRYQDLSVLLSQAREVFPESSLAEEGKVFEV